MPVSEAAPYMEGLKLRPYPAGVNLELTSRCCLRCDFCLNPKPGFRQKGDIGLPLLRKLAAELPPETVITLCGIGEPALHPEFAGICMELGAKFPSLQLVTNGQVKEKKVIEAVISSGMKKVTVSLDYFDEKEYAARKGGSLSRVVEFIDELLRLRGANGPVLQVNMLAQAGIEGQVAACLNYFSGRLRPGDMVYSRHIKDLAGQVEIKPLSDPDINLEDFRSKVGKLADISRFAVENWSKFLGFEIRPGGRLPCRHLYLYAMALCDGRVVPCCIDFNAVMPIGDLNAASMRAIWNGEAYSKMRSALELGHYACYPLCRDCGEWYKQK